MLAGGGQRHERKLDLALCSKGCPARCDDAYVGAARAYGVFASGGEELHLRPETLRALSAPATPSAHGFYDECLKGDVRFSLGFMKPSPAWPFGGESSFGSPGAGGALGFADPDAGIGYAAA